MLPGLTPEQQAWLEQYQQQQVELGRDALVAHSPAGMPGTADAGSSGVGMPVLLGLGALALFLLLRGR